MSLFGRSAAQVGRILQLSDVMELVGLPMDVFGSQQPCGGHVSPRKGVQVHCTPKKYAFSSRQSGRAFLFFGSSA